MAQAPTPASIPARTATTRTRTSIRLHPRFGTTGSTTIASARPHGAVTSTRTSTGTTGPRGTGTRRATGATATTSTPTKTREPSTPGTTGTTRTATGRTTTIR